MFLAKRAGRNRLSLSSLKKAKKSELERGVCQQIVNAATSINPFFQAIQPFIEPNVTALDFHAC
jgi:hypothetical protein